jgi:hypothetical protein
MTHIGIVGARTFTDRQTVDDLVEQLATDTIVVTSGCKGVCTWAYEKAKERGLEVMVYSPDLTDIRAWFEVARRYYERNRDLIEHCDLVHTFFSHEHGYTGGTRFEAHYALRLGKPVVVHREKGATELIVQGPVPLREPYSMKRDWLEFFNQAW